MLPVNVTTNILDRKAVFNAVRDDIASLYTAAIQYRAHANYFKGPNSLEITKDLFNHADDDLNQAGILTAALSNIDEPVGVTIKDDLFFDGNDMLLDLRADLYRIVNNIEVYKTRIGQLSSIGEYGFVAIYQDMLNHEQEHFGTITQFLGTSNPDIDPGNDKGF